VRETDDWWMDRLNADDDAHEICNAFFLCHVMMVTSRMPMGRLQTAFARFSQCVLNLCKVRRGIQFLIVCDWEERGIIFATPFVNFRP
jgi:hypothetical protein